MTLIKKAILFVRNIKPFSAAFIDSLHWTSIWRELIECAKNENKIRIHKYHLMLFIIAHLSVYLPP